MSFFDEVDEPEPAPRRPPRRRPPSGGGRRPPSRGGGGRPPVERQAIQVRRAIAIVVGLVLLVLIIVGVHACDVSQRNNSLKNYNNNVASLIQQSEQMSSTLFKEMTSGATSATSLYNEINLTRASADHLLSQAQALSVPSEMNSAQTNLLLTLRMRRDGIAQIAQNIEPALGNTASQAALSQIAAATANFYASDVVYVNYTTPLIASALHAADIAVGGVNGETIQGGQFLPDLQWLQPSYIASQLHVSPPSSGGGGKPAPGLHGHTLNSVSWNGNQLSSSGNTVTARPAPTFELNITNGGHFTENNVTCKVSVTGTNVSGQKVLPQTSAGQTTNCPVTLSSAPPTGNYTVTFEVLPVPGEKNTANNTLSFPVTFQ